MKNIYLLPTDKPSRLCYDKDDNLLFAPNAGFTIADGKQNIYITNDEEIKYGYVLNTFNNSIYKIVPDNSSREILANPNILPLCAINKEHYFKIILTTDPDLIADGVQAIDDEFLEWFCSKNGEVDFVEVIAIEDEKN